MQAANSHNYMRFSGGYPAANRLATTPNIAVVINSD